MAQNAANIEQEAAKEEAMLAAMEEELPTDEELEAQLSGDGFVGFEDDDDDYEDDGYEDDGLDESEEDMTAEAMAESDAASAMADASNPPERRRAGLSVSAQGNRSLCNAMAMHC